MPKKPKRSDKARPGLPTREQVLAFIREHPGEAGKREIARAFGITGSPPTLLHPFSFFPAGIM